MAESRRYGFAEINFGPATMLIVGVKAPATEHSVSVGKVQVWLAQVRSPREQIEKARLRNCFRVISEGVLAVDPGQLAYLDSE